MDFGSRNSAAIPIDGFTCGSAELDRFLIRYAFGNQQANASQTYLGLHGSDVVGYYTLAVGDVAYADAPERLTKGLARHPVPIMLLARLGVSTSWQGRKTIRPGGSMSISDLSRRPPTSGTSCASARDRRRVRVR